MVAFNQWAAANAGFLLAVLALLALAGFGLALRQTVRMGRLERHYALLTQGTNGGDLQAVLEAHAAAVRQAGTRVAELDGLLRALDRRSRGCLQRFGFLRFNPFRDAGGDQSFALALADRDGNGVVISSLHAREGTRIYGKPLTAWSSVYPLGDEERQAIEKAKSSRD